MAAKKKTQRKKTKRKATPRTKVAKRTKSRPARGTKKKKAAKKKVTKKKKAAKKKVTKKKAKKKVTKKKATKNEAKKKVAKKKTKKKVVKKKTAKKKTKKKVVKKKTAKKKTKKKVAKKKTAKKAKKATARSRRRGKRKSPSSGVPQYLLSLELENVRCFGPAQRLELANGRGRPFSWTVIFGDNGVGKTTVLQALCGVASTLQDRKEVPSFIRYNWWPKRKHNKATSIRTEVLLRPKEVAEFSVVYGPERKRISPPPVWNFNREGTLNYFGYGASRRHGQAADAGRKPLESSGDESLFVDDAELLNSEEWFVQMSHFGPSRRQLSEARAAKKVRDLLKAVLLDVSDIRISYHRGQARVEFKTHYGYVPLGELSMGYRTMIAWVVDFARRMYLINPRSQNPLAHPAVVCVDELDLHLHQRWQRNLMQTMSKTFPKTQFICSAHNRTVLQAVPPDANLVLLRRKGDHVVIHNHAQELLEGVR